jgi:fibronectin-binding autotransporter adhesin
MRLCLCKPGSGLDKPSNGAAGQGEVSDDDESLGGGRALRRLPLFLRLALVLWPLMLGLVASPAFAQTNWTGAAGSWFVPGNWSAGVPTGATTTTTVGNGGTAQVNAAGANAGNTLVINGAGSTVDVQAGGNLTGGNVVNNNTLSIDSGGTFNLNGTLSGTGTTFPNGGTLRAATTSSVTGTDVVLSGGVTSTIVAAAGQTLTVSPTNFGVNANAALTIGSASDTGTVVFNTAAGITGVGTQTYEVVGGTWRSGGIAGISSLTAAGLSTTVDAGATLDLNDFNTAVNTLLGAGRVTTGVNAATTLTLGGNGNFSGAITGAGQLVVFNGTNFLTGTNTYTGGTTVNPGATLVLSSGGSISGNTVNNGTFSINSGGTYNLSGTLSGTGGTFLNGGTLRAASTSTVTVNNLTLVGGVTSTIAAAAGQTLTVSPTSFGVNANAALKIGSASDTGTVVFNTAAGVISPGTQTYEVVGGTWRSGGIAGISSLTAAGLSTTVDAGATLDLNDFNTAVNTLLGAGRVTTGVNAATTLTLGGNGNFSGAITGAGQLVVFSGTTILTGTNTYTGGTTINAGGALLLGSGGSIGGSTVSNGNLVIDSGGTYNLSGTLSGTGGASLNGGTLRAASTSSVTVNDFVLSPGATSTISAAAGQTLTFSPGTLFVQPNIELKIGSATDTGVVVFSTNGVIFAGVQTYEVVGGTWRNGSLNGGFNFFTADGLSTTVDAGATLDLNDFNSTVNTLLGAGRVTTGVNAATTLFLTGNSNFSGAITGAGQLDVFSGTTILTGANTYTGGTTINAGTTLQLGSGGTAGSIVGNVADNGTFVINRAGTLLLSGNISGAGILQQIGPGLTILSGTNTYAGATTVSAGTLEVDGSIASSSSVTVNSGGTLSGTGIVDPATTTIMSGGTLAPGNAANPTGTLTITGNLVFQTGALYLLQLGASTAANANVAGTATLTGANVQVGGAPGEKQLRHSACRRRARRHHVHERELEQSELQRQAELHGDRCLLECDRHARRRDDPHPESAERRQHHQQCFQRGRHAAGKSRRCSD